MTFTLIGPWSDPVALFFVRVSREGLPVTTGVPYWAGLAGKAAFAAQPFPSGGLTSHLTAGDHPGLFLFRALKIAG